MTKEEVKKKGQEKIQALETLCKQLQITISAEQMITPQGLIKMMVYYQDTEKYDIEEETKTSDENQTA